VDSRKAAAAVAANHTHSLDSAHLHATVLKCHDDYGIKDFFLIHDSFATNPADTAAMFNAVRQAFVDQYDHECLYQRLKDQVIEQLDHPDAAGLPEVPEKGTLDLKQVLKSDYCFI
jgi:DNA-directed RNA polymerase